MLEMDCSHLQLLVYGLEESAQEAAQDEWISENDPHLP